jgi:hypothetical protein
MKQAANKIVNLVDKSSLTSLTPLTCLTGAFAGIFLVFTLR